MSQILCLETATKACSVALVKEDSILAERNLLEDGYMHAEKLHVCIDEVLKESGLQIHELDAIAVGKGPGSYTGLRIGVSAAKGLCFGADIPLISVSTLQSMAAFAQQLGGLKSGNLRPLLDARRMEVYSAAYNLDLEEIEPCKALLLEENPFGEELNQQVTYFFGDGMEKAKEELSKHPNARFIESVYPKASYMAGIATKALESGSIEDTAYFEPFYLKDFVAGKPKKLL